MYTTSVHLLTVTYVVRELRSSLGRVTFTPEVEVARLSMAVMFNAEAAQLNLPLVQVVLLPDWEQ